MRLALVVLLVAGCSLERQGLAAPGIGPAVPSDARSDGTLDAARDADPVPSDSRPAADGRVRDGAIAPPGWHEPASHHRLRLGLAGVTVAERVAELVVPVHLNASRIDYARTRPNAVDLHFRDADGTLLAHEVERWDPAGDSLIWVRLPAVGALGGGIWLYFGDPRAVSTEDAHGTWPSSYLAVYHFSAPEPLGGEMLVRDSTANGFHGRFDDDRRAPLPVAGPLASAMEFRGTETAVLRFSDGDGGPPPFHPELGGQRVYEAWFRVAEGDASHLIYGEGCCRGYGVGFDENGAVNGYLGFEQPGPACCDNHNYYTVYSTTPPPRDDQWHSVVFVADRVGHRLALYVDGELRDERGLPDRRSTDGRTARFGSNWEGGQRLLGAADELRIGDSAPSPARIALLHAAARDQLIEYGAVESYGP